MATNPSPDEKDNPLAGQDVTTKYGTCQSSEWRWRNVHGHPRVTDHFQEQWDKRTPPGSVSPEYAYLNGLSLGVLSKHREFIDKDGRVPEDVMLYHDTTEDGESYTPLIVLKPPRGYTPDDDVKPLFATCLRFDFINHVGVKSYCNTMAQQFPLGGDD